MTNLIAKVAELRELEGRRQAIIDRQKETARPNHALLERLGIERDMVNAAPEMLAALGKVQAGDMLMIENIISCMKTLSMDEYGEYTNSYDNEIAFLRRYADLARLMEDEYAT